MTDAEREVVDQALQFLECRDFPEAAELLRGIVEGERHPPFKGLDGAWDRVRGVVSDLASRECEAPGECGVTEAVCLPCRARALYSG